MSQEAPPPDRIGPYKVISALARGGMASVYEVEDDETGQRMAAKLLTQRGLARPRFLREYQALTRLDHPHIVRVYRFGITEGGLPWLTMELLDGQPAQVYAKALGRPGTPRRTAEVLRIAREIAAALAYLHDRGIIHRDLKSSNVMVLPGGAARLLDFGTARWMRAQDEITRHGEFVGTFAYAPPEQLTGGPVDARSDLYSLGVLIYRLLTGKRPFEGDNPHDLARLHLEYVPPPPSEVAAGIPPGVSQLVCQLLDKDPAGRPASAWVVQERLEAHLHQGREGGNGEAEAPPELVGREDAVATLRELLQRQEPGSMGLVLGPSGSGRERLLLQLGEMADRDRWRVLPGSFDEGAPLGALAAIGRAAGRGLALAPEAGPPLAWLSAATTGAADGEAFQADRAASALLALLNLRSALDDRPVLLVLRRLHRADPAALDALRLLKAELRARRLPVLLLGSSSPEADQPDLPLGRALPDALRLHLGPVDRLQMGRLVTTVLGRRPPPPGLGARIHHATGGMPGHAVEVLHAMIREGLLVQLPGADSRLSWRDQSGGKIAFPPRLREMLELRIAALGPAARRLLDALAVAGVPVPADRLGPPTDLSPQALGPGLQELRDSRLVQATATGLAPALGMTEQLVREQLRESRRHLLRERLADALLDQPASEGKVRLMLEADRIDRAIDDAETWARACLAAHEASVALPLLSRLASRVATDDAIDGPKRARLLLLLGRAWSEVEPEDPRAAEALHAASELANPEVLSEIDLEAAALARRQGDLAQARALLARASHRLERFPDAALQLRLTLEDGEERAVAGDSTGALAAWRGASRAAAGVPDPQAEARARVGIALALAGLGRIREAHAELDTAHQALRAAGDATGAATAALHLSEILRLQGRLSEALHLLERRGDPMAAGVAPFHRAASLLDLAETRIELLRLGEARDLLAEADAFAISRSHPWLRACNARLRGRLALACEDPEEALSLLQPAVRATEASGFESLAHTLRARLGEALAAAGAVDDGLRAARASVRGLRQLRQLPALAEACGCLQRASGPQADPDLIWEPVLSWLEAEPARLLRMDLAVARVTYAARQGDPAALQRRLADAQSILGEIAALLEPADRAALSVHPWRSQLDLHGRAKAHK